MLVAKDAEKAHIVCNFINDNRYGNARLEQADDQYHVAVQIRMPTQQNILCSVSALMVCIARIFDVEYDGWSSEPQYTAPE